MDTIMNMPIADRKYYITMHNNSERGGSESTAKEEKADPEMEKMKMINSIRDR